MKYMVTLNGKKYEIEVEEGQAIVNSVTTAPMAGAPVAAAPAVAPAPVAAPAALPLPPARCTRLRLPLRQMAQTLCAQCPARF